MTSHKSGEPRFMSHRWFIKYGNTPRGVLVAVAATLLALAFFVWAVHAI